MSNNHSRRKRYYTPGKGTKVRSVLLRMLSRRGVSVKEALDEGIISRRSDMAAIISTLDATGGWDIRAFPENIPGQRAGIVRYRVVGRLRWGRIGYRSFITSETIIGDED